MGLLGADRAGSERPPDARARQDPRHGQLYLMSDPVLVICRKAVDCCVTGINCDQRAKPANVAAVAALAEQSKAAIHTAWYYCVSR
jgi:hypothetical protein